MAIKMKKELSHSKGKSEQEKDENRRRRKGKLVVVRYYYYYYYYYYYDTKIPRAHKIPSGGRLNSDSKIDQSQRRRPYPPFTATT